MKSRLVSAALLAAALAFAVPSQALAQGRGNGGDHGNRGHGNGGGGGDRGAWHGGGGGGRGDRGGSPGGGGDHGGNGGGGDRGGWRAGGGDHGGNGGGGDRGSWRAGGGGEVRYRPQGGGGWNPPRTYYRGGIAPRTYYRGGYATYRYGGYRSYPRYFYYNSFFHRPHFFRSAFSIGFVIGGYPEYGYRYYDPYCGRYFNNLDFYDDHCDDFSHPAVIEVIHYGDPVATCVFDGGRWVVDDCY